ncbi:MAG: hypothetical protein A4E31_01188 [Methanomassiliicoccales archaeon PtaU1.Bin030]|nr:MAG: hypothetical protein A4E31_01188 [Methanomassiliicoccales archaeon PtaU1.Bin030]
MNTGWDVLWVLGAYLMANVAALVIYYADKRAASRMLRRVPERTLLLVALIGPFGALVAMRSFRHKTKKNKFLVVYLFALLHILLAAYLLTR